MITLVPSPTKGRPLHLAIIDATAARPCARAQCPGTSIYETAIANRPLIVHVLRELRDGGITHAHIVARPDVRHDLGRVISAGGAAGIDVSYVEAAGSGARYTVLSEIESALSEDAVLLHPGDGLFGSGRVIEMRQRIQVGDVDSVLPERADADAVPQGIERVSDAIMALGPRTRSLVTELLALGDDGDDLMSVLLASDSRLALCAGREPWRYSDTTAALLEANRLMLDLLEAPGSSHVTGENNRIRGRVAISSSAYLSDCVIQGPVTVAERAVIEDSFIGPYTAIGPDVVLSGAEIDNSMVLAGAEVRHPGSRIEGSILGERSQIMRNFELPRGLHLRLGPDSRLTLN
jgi:glucose-1-phosphate thymidylyltransferase